MPSIKWFKDGKPIEKVQRPPNFDPYIQKPKKWRLTISGLLHSDEGTYTCLIENKHGNLSHTYRVEAARYLQHKPILKDLSKRVTIMSGMRATLYCKFYTDLSYVIRWIRPAPEFRGENMKYFDSKNNSHFQTLMDRDGRPAIGEYLRIDNATIDDAGDYYCVAVTNSGMTAGFPHLQVLESDEVIIESPTNISARLGEPAVFHCGTHEALLKYTSWVRFRPENLEEPFEELVTGAESYRILNITEDDVGTYACVVGENEAIVQNVVHLDLEPEIIVMPDPVIAGTNRKLQIVASSICVVALVLLVFVLYIYRRYKREKVKKQQAIENAHTVTQWTKKVIIERQASQIPGAPIIEPIIRIEKQNSVIKSTSRSRLGSENTTLTTVSEYELPLDPDWELKREYLKIGQTLGEGQFGKVRILQIIKKFFIQSKIVLLCIK